ncbi:MAG: hypothetical protein FJX71_01390 [Alphaproteobacteria bacterium]|nr:hypothetical protein [Alphaproteobacteria bacterium]
MLAREKSFYMKKDTSKQSSSSLSGLGFAYRLGLEFISGILVGLILGYTIDEVFGTKPWGMVGMVLLGSAAGLLNIFRLLGFYTPSIKPNSKFQGDKKDG